MNNLFSILRERFKSALTLAVISVSLFGCGAVMTFYLAPRQALQARRISQLPMMNARHVSQAEAGSEVVVTGYLMGDPVREQPEFIAYTKEKWSVSVSTDDDGTESFSGSWNLLQTVVPELTLEMGNAALQIHASADAGFDGALHEKVIDGEGSLRAVYQDQTLHEGALRYRGFASGDLTTVFGKKASVGGILPAELFAGDRVAFEEAQSQKASTYLLGGIAFMLCSPLILLFGAFSALFGRKK